MSESEWTPGPWRWDGEILRADPADIILWPGNAVLGSRDTAQQMGACGRTAESRSDENRALIASAPELYEALCEAVTLLSALTASHPDDAIANAVKDQARAALAKARGETP